jgi:hypothetical protein
MRLAVDPGDLGDELGSLLRLRLVDRAAARS